MKIVGAGITGATIARILTDKGLKVIIYERNEIGGLCADKYDGKILVHKNGAHIWHNSYPEVQEFIERFTEFNNYIHRVKACKKGQIYSFPINLETFSQVFGASTPKEAKQCDLKKLKEMFYTRYSLKQWGVKPPRSVLDRIPVRYDFNDRYFDDIWQGIPIGGYKQMIENMLDGIEVIREDFKSEADIYTGAIDEYFNYVYGMLPYRSMNFVHKIKSVPDFQGISVINHTDDKFYTRVIEHKHFHPVETNHTIISYEYPGAWRPGMERHYPMFDYKLYRKYKALGGRTIFAGRLGQYKYLNMNETVKQAMDLCKQIVSE